MTVKLINCPVVEHLNKVFAENLSNSLFSSVDEHMYKFKGRSSMKQYIKNKSIKWGFKCCYRCDSVTGYVYQSEFYQGQKEKRELNLGSSVALDFCQVLKDTCSHVFFHNFFNSPTLIQNDNGCMIMDCMVSVQLVSIELTCRR